MGDNNHKIKSLHRPWAKFKGESARETWCSRRRIFK